MPPKIAGPDGMDPILKFTLSVLKNCESVKPAWEAVAKENGIGYGKNAQAKFKNLLDKLGFKYDGTRVVSTSEDASTDTPPAPAKATPKTPKSATAAKRKVTEGSVDATDETPTKSAKKRKSVVKMEENIKDEDGADNDMDKEALGKKTKKPAAVKEEGDDK